MVTSGTRSPGLHVTRAGGCTSARRTLRKRLCTGNRGDRGGPLESDLAELAMQVLGVEVQLRFEHALVLLVAFTSA